jgi:hypothetical protein
MAIMFLSKASPAKPPEDEKPVKKRKLSSQERTKKWRAAHPDEYRAYMREHMRKKRAKDAEEKG